MNGDQKPMNVRLVQSARFPNLWSLVDDNGDEYTRTFKDGLLANGAIAAESAVHYARENGMTIVGIDSDDRTVIAGIEYRSRQPVVGKYEHEHVTSGKRCHVIEVYATSDIACVLWQDTGWNDEVPITDLREVTE